MAASRLGQRGLPLIAQGERALGAVEQTEHQDLVNSHFTKVMSYWAEIYESDGDLDSYIFQQRLRAVLDLAGRAAAARDTRALEIGCGAGLATVALARAGFTVDALDAVPTMVQATADRSVEAGVAGRVRSQLGDVRALPFADGSFGMVVAIGVLPWLPDMEPALRQMFRVLRPGGYLIVTTDNKWCLSHLLNPVLNPCLEVPKQAVKALLARFGRVRPPPLNHADSIAACDELYRRVGFRKLDGITLGFGPFKFLGHALLPNRLGLRAHRALQSVADRGIPVIRSAGHQYIFLGRKPSASADDGARAAA